MISYFNNKAKVGRDNYETPEHVWKLFFSIYKNRDSRIWLPFYCKGTCAPFVEKHHGTKFIHVNEDFFNYEPKEWDVLVDNPPYSCKQEVFQRCILLGKPFALYIPLETLERKYISELMNSTEFQIIIPKKRTDFITDYEDVKFGSPPHKTAWFCWRMKLLDGRQLIFEE